MSNRIGRLKVNNVILSNCPTFWTEYLKDVKVISQEPLIDLLGFIPDLAITVFTCECEVFDEYEGDPANAPEYIFYFDRDENGTIERCSVEKVEPLGRYWATK